MNGTRSKVRALAAQSAKVPDQLQGQQQQQKQAAGEDQKSDNIGQQQKRAAGEDEKSQDPKQETPPQKLSSLYETPHLTFATVRQSLGGRIFLNWLESVEPYNPRQCRSETNVQVLPDFYTKAPPVLDLQDTAMAPPLVQESLVHSYERSHVVGSTLAQTTTQRAVESRDYRSILSLNGIELLEATDELADAIKTQVNAIKESENPPVAEESTFASRANVWMNAAIMGANEARVKQLFETNLFNGDDFPKGICSNDAMMKKGDIPIGMGAEKISAPKPDLLLGYDVRKTVLKPHAAELSRWDINGAKFCFLSVNYKGDGDVSSGRLWVATNQCLIATATCVNIIRRLRQEALKLNKNTVASELDQFTFGLVANGTEARLFVTYADEQDGTIYMKLIRGFLLYEKDHRMELERWIGNIFAWALKRVVHIKAALDAIQTALDAIQAEMSRGRTHPLASSCCSETPSKRQRKMSH